MSEQQGSGSDIDDLTRQFREAKEHDKRRKELLAYLDKCAGAEMSELEIVHEVFEEIRARRRGAALASRKKELARRLADVEKIDHDEIEAALAPDARGTKNISRVRYKLIDDGRDQHAKRQPRFDPHERLDTGYLGQLMAVQDDPQALKALLDQWKLDPAAPECLSPEESSNRSNEHYEHLPMCSLCGGRGCEVPQDMHPNYLAPRPVIVVRLPPDLR